MSVVGPDARGESRLTGALDQSKCGAANSETLAGLDTIPRRQGTKPTGDPIRLGNKALEENRIPPSILTPNYNRDNLVPSFVSLGVTSRLLGGLVLPLIDACANEVALEDSKQQLPFGVIGVGFTPAKKAGESGRDTLKTLQDSDGLYTLTERGADEAGNPHVVRSVVGCVQNLLRAGADTAQILDHIADTGTTTVFMSVRADRYYLGRDNKLDISKSPEMMQDIINPSKPSTAIGILVEGIRKRMESDPNSYLSVFCAENLPSPSGPIVHSVFLDYCRSAYPSDQNLYQYILDHVFVPSVMVDRVCPDDTQMHKEWSRELQEETQLLDLRPLHTEGVGSFEVVIDVGPKDDQKPHPARAYFLQTNPFKDFCGQNVTITEGLGKLYATTKQRVVNGTHVIAAEIGTFFMGPSTPVHAVLADPTWGTFLKDMLSSEISPSLNGQVPDERDLDEYIRLAWRRLSNPYLPDPVARIDDGVFGRLPRVLAIETDLSKATNIQRQPEFPAGPALTYALWTVLRTLELRAGGEAYKPEDNSGILSRISESKKRHAQILMSDPAEGVVAVFNDLANADMFGDMGSEPNFVAKVSRHIREIVPWCYPSPESADLVH
jgi:mannitol 2-dehydrogenase